jgi:hypothetical protein
MVHYWQCADEVLKGLANPERRDFRYRVAKLCDRALDMAGRPPALPALECPVSRDDGYGLAVIGWRCLSIARRPGRRGRGRGGRRYAGSGSPRSMTHQRC